MTPDPEDLEVDEELQAAAQHLTQDFLCHVIHEEGRGNKTDSVLSELEAEPDLGGVEGSQQSPPLGIALRTLTNAVSLNLQQTLPTFSESRSEPASGEIRLMTSSRRHVQM